MGLRKIKMAVCKDTGCYKTKVGGIPYIESAIYDHRICLRRGTRACQRGLTSSNRAKYQHKHDKDLDKTFELHGHVLLLNKDFAIYNDGSEKRRTFIVSRYLPAQCKFPDRQ